MTDQSRSNNGYVQLASDGGLLVSLPAAALLFAFARAARRRLREAVADPMIYWIRVGAIIGIVAIALQELVDFSLQIPGNAVLFAVLAAPAIGGPAIAAGPYVELS